MFNPRDTSPAAVRSMFLQQNSAAPQLNVAQATPTVTSEFLTGTSADFSPAQREAITAAGNAAAAEAIRSGRNPTIARVRAENEAKIEALRSNQQSSTTVEQQSQLPADAPLRQEPISSPLESRIGKSLSKPTLGIEDLIRGADDTADAPFASDEAQNRAAQSLGEQIFAQEEINADADEQDIEKLATNNRDDVPDSLKNVYDKNTNIAQTLGAIVKLQNDSESTKLLKSLVDEKTTPADARKEVAEFFNTGDEVPVWADVALAIGLDLLDPKTGTGTFFGDAASAGKAGLAAAKVAKGRSDAMNKLAFGIYREDKKNRQTLSVQLAKSIGDDKEAAQKLRMDFAKFFQNQEKINQTEASNKAAKVISTLGLLDKDQKKAAYPIVSRLLIKGALDGVSTEDVPAHVFGMLKSGGLKLEDVADAKDIVESSVTISDENQFNMYKQAFPSFFKDIEFRQGKTYKIDGFSNKGAPAGELAMTNIIGVSPSIGGQDAITRLITRRAEIRDAIKIAETNREDTTELKEELTNIQGAIANQSTRKTPQSYVFADGMMVAAGEGAAGAYAAADAVSKANELGKQGSSLASAYGLADGLMRSLASGETPNDNVGVLSRVGKFSKGIKGQFTALYNSFGDNRSDSQDDYISGTITSAMTGNNQAAVTDAGLGDSRYTVGQVFKQLEKMANGNAEIQSQLMSFAYALAGSRETGKLTDKDVAAALVTFGGGDIADGKWFANADTLMTGINQALTTATNDYAIRYNKVHQNPSNLKYLRDVEELSDAEIEDRTNFNLNGFLKKNQGIRAGLADRVIFNPQGADGNQLIRMQSLDKYKADGAGNVDPTSRLSAAARTNLAAVNAAANRTKLDPSDPNYLTIDQFNLIVDTIPPDVRQELIDAGSL